MERERHPLGLPEPAEPVEIGAVRIGGSELRVSVHEGEHGPKIDFREYVLPRRPEATRAYVPKGKGRGRVPKEPFVGFTKKGFRLDVETTGTLVALLVEAMAATEDEGREAV